MARQKMQGLEDLGRMCEREHNLYGFVKSIYPYNPYKPGPPRGGKGGQMTRAPNLENVNKGPQLFEILYKKVFFYLI